MTTDFTAVEVTFREFLRTHHLSYSAHRFRILHVLLHADKPLTHGELCQRSHTSRDAIWATLKILSDCGLVVVLEPLPAAKCTYCGDPLAGGGVTLQHKHARFSFWRCQRCRRNGWVGPRFAVATPVRTPTERSPTLDPENLRSVKEGTSSVTIIPLKA